MARRKSTIKLKRKLSRNTRKKVTHKGGSRTEIASLFPEGGFDALDWNFYLVSGHGNLSENMFEIPANTYILNLSTTGRSCMGFNWDLEGIMFAKGETAEDLKSMKEEIYDRIKKGLLTKSSSAFREFIYTEKGIQRDIEELYETPTDGGDTTLAYYEPGDYMFDTEIYFRNHSFPILFMGVYELPMKKSLKEKWIDANELIWTDGKRPSSNLVLGEDFSGRLIIPEGETENTLLDKYDTVFNVPENLALPVMFPNGNLFHLPGDYNKAVYRGVKNTAVPLEYYSEEQIKKLKNNLYPEDETEQERSDKLLQRLLMVSPPTVSSGLLRRPTSYPYLKPERKIPTLYDVVKQLNHLDSRPKLIIVQLCRSINNPLKQTNFTPQITRRMSLAARERSFPRAATATQAEDLSRLRSQLRRPFIQRLKEVMDRGITSDAASKDATKKAKFTAASTKLDTLLKKDIFGFRDLRNVLRDIHSQGLAALQQPFIDLLQLNQPLPAPKPANTILYGDRVYEFFKIKNILKAFTAAKKLANETAQSKKKTLESLTEQQKIAVRDFMGQMMSFTRGQLATNPTDMEKIYWTWVDAHLIDPSKPPLTLKMPLKNFLRAFDHKELLKAGIDITPEGWVKV